jgi:chromate transporter
MVAYIGDFSVKRKQWLDQETFRKGVVLSQSIPGATAMQVAAYVGLRTRGIPGALCTFIGFGLPAFVFMAIISHFYSNGSNLPWIRPLFTGLQVIVVSIVANATYTFGREALKCYADIFIAAALFWSGVSPFSVILGAAAAGVFLRKEEGNVDTGEGRPPAVPLFHICALLLIVVGGTALLSLFHRELFRLSLLMMKIDLFAFGGGFASVPLMLQEIVNVRGWIDGKTFMDGIALGQITPGPIVITATFVGYLLYGFPGALAARFGIFTPSFLLVTISAGFFNKLTASSSFRSAVKGIFASFVGLLLYVTIKFAFAVPWDLTRIFIAIAALAALLKKVDILYIVLAAAGLSLLLFR